MTYGTIKTRALIHVFTQEDLFHTPLKPGAPTGAPKTVPSRMLPPGTARFACPTGFHQTPALFAASKAVPPSTRAQHVSVCAMFPEWAFLADKSADRYKMSLLSSFQKCLLCRYPANLFF